MSLQRRGATDLPTGRLPDCDYATSGRERFCLYSTAEPRGSIGRPGTSMHDHAAAVSRTPGSDILPIGPDTWAMRQADATQAVSTVSTSPTTAAAAAAVHGTASKHFPPVR